jgi:hypothetical protein
MVAEMICVSGKIREEIKVGKGTKKSQQRSSLVYEHPRRPMMEEQNQQNETFYQK